MKYSHKKKQDKYKLHRDKQAKFIAAQIKKDFNIKVFSVGAIRRCDPSKKAELLIEIDSPSIRKEIDLLLKTFAENKLESFKNVSKFIYNTIQFLVYFAYEKNFAAAALFCTGNDQFYISCKTLAKNKGFKLTYHGLFNRKTNELIPTKTEKKIFEKIGLKEVLKERYEKYIRPELRRGFTGHITRKNK